MEAEIREMTREGSTPNQSVELIHQIEWKSRIAPN